jgi:hypothetical protein
MKLAKRFDKQFSEVVSMIHQARYNAIKSVNAELVKLYWSIGEYISKKIAAAEWGDAVVDQLASYIQNSHPEFIGFTRRGLYRMRQCQQCRHKLAGQITCRFFLKLSQKKNVNFI